MNKARSLPMFFGLVLSLTAAACSTAADDGTPTSDPADANALVHSASPNEANTATVVSSTAGLQFDPAALAAKGGVAYFAGGCFWGVEHFLEQIDGVYAVESGYMGGQLDDPSYADVTGHESGHLETVRVYFDPDRVSYEAVTKRFFEIHDPTQANGQGPDIGPQYLSAVFVASDAQREVSEDLVRRLRERGFDVATKLLPAADATFWPAEEYHQNYYVRHKKVPYCHAPVDRFGDGA